MFKGIIYLILIIFNHELKASTICKFNNDKYNIKLNTNVIKNYYFFSKNTAYPTVNLNFSAVKKINNYLNTFLLVDTNLKLNNFFINRNLDFIKTKIYFAGLRDVKYGSVSFGRNYGVIFNVDNFIKKNSIMNFYGPRNFMLYKSDNILTYKNYNFFNYIKGLDIFLQKQFENKEDIDTPLYTSTRLSNGDGYGIYIKYKINSFLDVAGAYSSSERTLEQTRFDLENRSLNASAYSLGFKINTSKLYISSVYGETYNITPYGNFLMFVSNNQKNKNINEPTLYGFSDIAKNTGLIAEYKFNMNLISSIGYFQSKIYVPRNIGAKYIDKCISLSLNYKLHKFVSAYGNYKINLLNVNDYFYKKTNIYCNDLFNLGFSCIF